MKQRSLSERKIRYIPPNKALLPAESEGKRLKRVAAYCRVSTDSKEQETSYDSQVRYYTGKIEANPDWVMVRVYADPAVSGTSRRNRLQFDKMIYDCLHGNIDVIITKSMSRFARNQLDCLAVIKLLNGLKPPVTVLFEDDHIDSSDLSMEVVMTIFSMLAEQESARKSSSVRWGLDRRREDGHYLTPTHNLLGYTKTKEINKDDRVMILVEDEAEIVRLIFYMFLAGFKVVEIANTLTAAGVTTSRGNTTWNTSSVLGILKNERYAGDVRTNKTHRDFRTHHTFVNRGEWEYVYEIDHHVPIVSHEIFDMAQKLIVSHRYGYDPFVNGTYSLTVIPSGLLEGFVPINTHWAGSTLQEYIDIAITKGQTADLLLEGVRLLCYPGCEVVRPQDLSRNKRYSLRITPSSLCLGSNCVPMLNSDFVEWLFDPVDKLIAARPTEQQMPGANRWKRMVKGKEVTCPVGCGAFTKLIYELMEWPQLWNVTVLAQGYTEGNRTVLIFDLTQYEINALPYAAPKKEKVRVNNDVYYDIELMIAQQIELLHQKQLGSLELEIPSDAPAAVQLPRPRRKRLHPGEWMNSFGHCSALALVQSRRYQASKLRKLDLDAAGVTPDEFDQSVPITDEMIYEKLSVISGNSNEEERHE